ncbi:MAG TPA: DUF547 domain-containing protein [Drouetiella sp.]
MQAPNIQKAIPVIFLSVGALLLLFHVIVNGGTWVKSAFLKVEHPITYHFPLYDQLLHEVVKGDAVDYKQVKALPLLNKAIDELASVAPDKLNSEKENLCYWLNAYNMLTLKLLSDRYPIDSPKKLGNARSFTKFTIGGDTLSVRDIIDLKLNPYFKRNPTLTFLVCDGAKGDPALLNHALVPETVIKDADTSLTNFVNNPANYKWDEVQNIFYISPYFQRYDDYFVAFYESPHALAASKMNKSIPVANVTLLKTFLRDFDSRLNDVDKSTAMPPNTTPSIDDKHQSTPSHR